MNRCLILSPCRVDHGLDENALRRRSPGLTPDVHVGRDQVRRANLAIDVSATPLTYELPCLIEFLALLDLYSASLSGPYQVRSRFLFCRIPC